jgi:hypothetical protein
MKLQTLPVFLTAVFTALAASAADTKVIKLGTRPESVTKGFGGHYYATVMGDDKPGDGKVVKIDGETLSDFATGLNEPKGICFAGKYLVTTDVTKVWKIDEKGEKTVLADAMDFPTEIKFLNDASAGSDGKSVFVTDMGARDKMFGKAGLFELDSPAARELPAIGRVYRITLDGKITTFVNNTEEMACPNGVSAQKGGKVLIGEFFFGNILEANSAGKLKQLNTGFRGADGIEQDGKGNIYLSSWTQGKVWKLDSKGQNAQVIAEGFLSAADFFLDEKAGLLLLPDMKAGTLNLIPLK